MGDGPHGNGEHQDAGVAALEGEVRAVLAVARAFMHVRPCILEVTDVAAQLGRPAGLEAALARLEARGDVMVQWRPGGVMGSAFVTQDGLRRWAEDLRARGVDPLPDYAAWAARIEARLASALLQRTEDLAAELEVPVDTLIAQLRVMEALGRVKANKRGQGIILSVQLISVE